jgi:hypothetical protein
MKIKSLFYITLDFKKAIENLNFEIIGLQPLLRPFYQKGLSISLNRGDNLNHQNYIFAKRSVLIKNRLSFTLIYFTVGVCFFLMKL